MCARHILYKERWLKTFFSLYQVRTAASRGAIGMISFPDPSVNSPEGISRDATYPNTPWLSQDALQLQSSFRKPYVGDKLTPGIPAEEWAYRMPYSNDSDFPKIPVQPISYGQARELLKRMKGW